MLVTLLVFSALPISGLQITNEERMSDSSVISTNNGIIFGRVYRYPECTLVKGAKVELRNLNRVLDECITGYDGSFEFTQGPYYGILLHVDAYKDNYQCHAKIIGNGSKSQDLYIAPPGSGKIFGYVKDFRGRPIEDAKVKLEWYIHNGNVPKFQYKLIETSSNGYYEFSNVDVAPIEVGLYHSNDYRLNITKQGYTIKRHNYIPVGADGIFEFQKDATIIKKSRSKTNDDSFKSKLTKNLDEGLTYGTVAHGRENYPINGAQIIVKRNVWQNVVGSTFTDAAGNYKLYVPTSLICCEIYAYKDELSPTSYPIVIESDFNDEGAVRRDIKMVEKNSGRIFGKIKNVIGKELSGVLVDLDVDIKSGKYGFEPWYTSTRSDSNGYYEFRNVPIAPYFQINAHADGYKSQLKMTGLGIEEEVNFNMYRKSRSIGSLENLFTKLPILSRLLRIN